MRRFLYLVVEIIAELHQKILTLNDRFEYDFSDKELHFLIIGILGMVMIWAIYPFFKWLANRKHVMVITWIYVFTLIIVLTFAIEIGQHVTDTGHMEFADIMFGLVGFLVMFAIFSAGRAVYHFVRVYLRRKFREFQQEKIVNEDGTPYDEDDGHQKIG